MRSSTAPSTSQFLLLSFLDFKKNEIVNQLLGLSVDPLGLHLDEVVKSVGGGVGGQVDQDGLGQGLEVVLNTVLVIVRGSP